MLASLAILNSCQPDTDDGVPDPNQPNAPAYTYSANLNGNTWKARINVTALVKGIDTGPFKRMDVNASSSDNKRLLVSVKDISSGIDGNGIAIRSYTLNGSSQSAQFSYETNEGNITYSGISGSVNITACDTLAKTVSGTFNAILVKQPSDTIKVTNGIIQNVPYVIFD
ncbi:MAG: hypothetical protein MUE96_01085 [Bacteroidia bacterium]|nr:hypothetical protein [Bacteroidia bacterium]